MRSSRFIHRSKSARFLFNPSIRTIRNATVVTVLAAVSLSVFVWQGSAAAGRNSAFHKFSSRLRSALNLSPAAVVQGGIGSRTVISTIAGGGLGTNAPVRQAPMVLPTAVAVDPLGRGFYVVDESNGASLLRFVNTTAAPVTLAGVTIMPGNINLIAGGGISAETNVLRDVDLTQVTGIVVDPSGNIVYLTAPLSGAIRAINVGNQDFSILRQTIQPATIKTIFNISRPDFRAITMNASREFFYIGVAQSGGARVVYKLDPAANGGSGSETVYAGGGSPVFGNGDGQQATQGKLTSPMGLAIDAGGNLLIAEGGDTRNNPGAVRRVDPNGIITTLIANLEFPTGITLGPNGSVYVALGNTQQIVRVSAGGAKALVAGTTVVAACDQTNNPNCGDGGPSILANLNLPGSTQVKSLVLATDATGIYLPDLSFRRVRYINTSGGTVTVAGVVIQGGQINSVAGSGQEAPYDNVPAAITEMQNPAGVAADANGNLFVADTNADPVGSIRFINRGQTPVTLFAGTAVELVVQPGHIVTLNNKAGEPALDDRISTAVFASPQGLAVTANGVYIVDSQYGALVRPVGSLTGRRSGHIRFLNTSASDVTIFPNGGAAKVVVPPGFIKDIVGRNDQPSAGSPTADDAPANTAIIFPTDVALDGAGNIYIADQGNNRIRKVNVSTGLVTSLLTPGSEGPTPLVTGLACGIAVTQNGRVYIADTKNDRVLRQDAPNGTAFTTIANSTAGINRPRDVTVDASGNVFVANAGTDQILRIVAPTNALGTVSVVAGTGQAGFSGDNGPANRARLNLLNPGTTSVDLQVTTNIITLANGDTLFADTENNRLRLLVQQPNQNPVLANITDYSLDEGKTETITITATDGNGDPLTITAQGVPSFATFTDNGDSTARLQIAPGFNDAGNYNLTVRVSDGDASDSKAFAIVVKDLNRAPVITITPLSPAYEATGPTGRVVSLLASASDPDGDTLTYQWFDGAAQIATAPSPQVLLNIGNHQVFLTVTDSKGLSASSPAQTLIVKDTVPPVITGIPADVTVQATGDEGAVVNYTMPSASDVVDGAVTVTADKASGSTFAVGATTVNFAATDSRGNQATASFKVTVTPKPGDPGPGPGPGTGCGAVGSYTISTFAGSGGYGFSGDGGDAVNASMKSVSGLGRDSAGVMVVDSQGRIVRRVDAQGKIRTIAGNSASGNTGDGNLAIYATFGATGGVATDASGNTYVSDTNFHRIRRIAPDGKIYHFAGSATGISGSAGDNGTASGARFNRPTALAIDAQGNLYVADSGNHRVRVINLSTNIITTAAGNGSGGFSADGVAASTAGLNNPTGIAVDAQGNLYIADRNNQRVRKVDAATKAISTMAGDGTQAFSGDGGGAAAAQLNNPNDVAVDSAGNIYIADQTNNRIRRIKTNGKIETIAGTGTGGYSGDGGAALQAQLNQPTSVTVDAACNVYVGDNGSLRVRKLTAVGGGGGPTNQNPVITSNTGDQTLTKGQTVDLPLSATDQDSDSVTFTLINAPAFASIVNANVAQRTATLRLAPTAAGTFAGVQVKADDGKGGTATSAAFTITVNEPQAGNNPPTANTAALPAMLEAISAAGAPVGLNGSGSDPDGDSITFAWTDNGNVIATSAVATVTLAIGNHSIVLNVTDSKGAKTSTPAQVVLVKDSTPPMISGVPTAIITAATTPAGAIVNFALPTATDAIDGNVTVTPDKAPNTLFPVGVTMVKFTAADSRGNAATASFTVTVTPFSSGATPSTYVISTFAGSGNYGFAGDGGAATDASFKSVSQVVRYTDGLLIVDSQGRTVRRVDAQGKIRTIAGNGGNGNTGDNNLAIYATMASPGGVAVDAQGNIYVSDTGYHRIRRITADGKINHFAGSSTGVAGAIGDNGTAAQARFNRPTALVIDSQNNLYIADSGNHRVRVINLSTNVINTIAGNGGAGYGGDGVPAFTASLNNPTGIAMDAQGNLFIADRNNYRIRKVDAASKQITTIAGNGTAGFVGDNASATAAQLNNPSDVAVDALGNVYIVDQTNNRIRRVNAAGIIETIAGTGVGGFSGDGGPALQAQISTPNGIEVESDGSVFFGDNGNLRVRKLAPAGPPPPPPPPANRNPVITSTIANQTLTKGQTVDLPITSTDEDNDSVTFTLVGAPAFASIINANPAARTATLRLAPTEAGTFNNVQVKADDGKGGTATSPAFSITVNEPVNQCIANVPGTHWRGEYFNNRNLAGSPVLVRDDGDGALNQAYGEASPSPTCGVPADQFSARFTREVVFQAGVYRFQAFADDGVRLFIDGQLRIDKWIDQAETRYDVEVALSTGAHTLRMEFYENTGAASARLFWNALNYFPVVNNIPNQTVRRGEVVDVSVTAADSDSDPVALTLGNAPAFVTLINADKVARKATLRIAPPAGDTDQQFNLTINADDGRGGQSASNPFTLTVTTTPPPPPPPANRAPVANAATLPASVVAPDESGATITLDGSASSDPDGDTLAYSWTDLGAVIATRAVVDVKLPIGTHAITLTVNDGKGGASSTAVQTVTINAPAPPAPSVPTITSISPAFGKAGTIVNVIVSGNGFVQGTIVTINGAGVSTITTYVNPNQVNVRVAISSSAFTTSRSATAINPNNASSTKTNAFSIRP